MRGQQVDQRLVHALSAVTLLCSLPALAQSAFSLREALERAESKSERLLGAQAGVQRAEAQHQQAFSEWLPQLSGTASYDRLLKSEYEGIFVAPEGAPGGLDFSELPFGRPNTWRAGLALTQNLYTGGRTTALLRQARAGRAIAGLQLEETRAAVVLEAAQAYYDAVLADQLHAIAVATFEQTNDTLRQVELSRKEGLRPEFDLLRARVAVDNQRPIVLQRAFERDLAYLRLKQLLELPADTALRLTSGLDATALDALTAMVKDVARIPDAPDGPRAVVRQSQQGVVVSEAAVSAAWSQHLPQLQLNSTYGVVSYPDSFLPRDWRQNWSVGVALRLSLFSGLRVRGEVRAARADLLERRALLRETEELTLLDTRTVATALTAAKAVWEASEGSVAQAEKAYELSRIRYDEGVSTQLELTDTRLQLFQARANRARASRDLQVAAIRSALLPHLPLSAAAPTSAPAAPTPAAAPEQANFETPNLQPQPPTGLPAF